MVTLVAYVGLYEQALYHFHCLECAKELIWCVTLHLQGTQIYDSKKGAFVDLGILDVLQIFGRAGRPQFDQFGSGTIITAHDKLSHYLSLLTRQQPIESQLVGSLYDNLNAEVRTIILQWTLVLSYVRTYMYMRVYIRMYAHTCTCTCNNDIFDVTLLCYFSQIALGTVTNVTEAVQWLNYTYLFIRMKANPLVYGISHDFRTVIMTSRLCVVPCVHGVLYHVWCQCCIMCGVSVVSCVVSVLYHVWCQCCIMCGVSVVSCVVSVLYHVWCQCCIVCYTYVYGV